MELYKDILNKTVEEEVCFTASLKIDAKEIVELACYRALREIKAVIEDDSLEDPECFMKIEEIVRVFERMGSDGGNRHDFG